MRIASFVLNGQRQVGLVDADGKTVSPLAVTTEQARRGAQAVIDLQVAGKTLPSATGQALPLSDVELEAPLPLPRRNLWCVGRNYHAHAKELSASVFKDNDANPDSWPIVFTKVPECVVGPFDNVVVPVGISDAIDYEAELAVVIGTGGKNTGWQRARKAVGLEQMRVHDLRHTFACRLRAAGVTAEDRCALLGHAVHSMSGHHASADVGRLVQLANLVLNRQETRTVLRVANGWPVAEPLWVTGPTAVPQLHE